MTLRTLTFDPAQYKLVRINPDVDTFVVGMEASVLGRPSVDDETYVSSIYSAMLSAVPDTLPGVVEHSGEPAGLLVETDHGPMYWPPAEIAEASAFCDDGVEPSELFTHPAPAQPVERQELSDEHLRLFFVANGDQKPMQCHINAARAIIAADRGQA